MNILENGVGYLAPSTSAEPQPGYLARVHPEHAEIPALPARYSPTSDYYWHFGFPVSIAEVRSILEELSPSRVRMSPTDDADDANDADDTDDTSDEDDEDDTNLMHELLVVTNRFWPFTKLFDVQPEEGSADNVQTFFGTLHDRRAVSFYSLMSTEVEHFVSRPGLKELKALTALFRKQPVWREDAIEKEKWADYYHEHYD